MRKKKTQEIVPMMTSYATSASEALSVSARRNIAGTIERSDRFHNIDYGLVPFKYSNNLQNKSSLNVRDAVILCQKAYYNFSFGKGSGIVGHYRIEIGNDVWTGHHVYITDQNHGYEDVTLPISRQTQPERPVTIGDGSWLGAGCVVLPGATIGKHVAVGANSVVTGELPDFCVAVGAPARVIRRYEPGSGWMPAQEFRGA